MQKPSTAKQKSEKKRKKKKVAVKNMAEIDVLHMHTQNKLHEMEMENKKNVYNFEVRLKQRCVALRWNTECFSSTGQSLGELV